MKTCVKALLLATVTFGAALPASAEDDTAARWDFVRTTIFGNRAVQDAGDMLHLTTPDRALDAALVPVTVELKMPKRVVALSLIIDNNPSPLVGTFHLGPAFTPKLLKLRVRVNDYTLIHAVAETEDGALYTTSQYMKIAGGCSAPGGGDPAEIAARMGKMQLRRTRGIEGVKVPAELMISHPNYNGMQMDAATHHYTPARYLQKITVTTGGIPIFDLDGDISMSEDPVISFGYTPAGDGTIDVLARDSAGAAFSRHFEALPQS
jgi:sulfur-oxidizing protein SoxY